MTKNFISGIVFSNIHDEQLPMMTRLRSFGSVPFFGRYRLIDFALSNMVKSKIDVIGVVTKSNFQSLMDHLGSGRDWDLDRKGGGLAILPPFANASHGVYRSRMEALLGTYDFINYKVGEYLVLSDCNYIFNIDYTDAVNRHIASGADITCVCKTMQLTQVQAEDAITFELDGKHIRSVRINPSMAGKYCCGLNSYIVSKKVILSLLDDCRGRGHMSFEEDVLFTLANHMQLGSYFVADPIIKIGDIESYYRGNLALLDTNLRTRLFADHRIYTKVHDEMPTKYGLEAKTSNCIVADGCIIEGTAERSVLFRGVTIEKGAIVRNSILMQGTRVCSNAKLEGVITDKNAVISSGRILIGSETNPLYVDKGKVV